MNLLRPPLSVMIPIVSLNDSGTLENQIIKITVYSNDINVGTAEFNSITNTLVDLIAFPSLSPRGEVQYFTMRYYNGYTVEGRTFNSYLQISANAASIVGEEYTFTIEFEVLGKTLRHTYTLDCPQPYALPLYVNPNYTHCQYTYIVHDNKLTLYKSNLHSETPEYKVNGKTMIGDCVTMSIVYDKNYFVEIGNYQTTVENPPIGTLVIDPAHTKVTLVNGASEYEFSVEVLNTQKQYIYSTTEITDPIGIGNVPIVEYSKLLTNYSVAGCLQSTVTLDNKVPTTIPEGEFTLTTFNRIGTLEIGKSVFYTGAICNKIMPCCEETNLKSTTLGTYFITTPMIASDGYHARNEIVRVAPSTVQPTIDVNFNGTVVQIPVKLYKVKMGYFELVKYLAKGTVLAISDGLEMISMTSLASTTAFIDVAYEVVNTTDIALFVPDIVNYDVTVDGIHFYTLSQTLVMITWTDVNGVEHAMGVSDATVLFEDGVYVFTVSIEDLYTQTITIVKTAQVDAYYEKLMLFSNITKCLDLDTQSFLSLRVLINAKKDLYLSTFNETTKGQLQHLLTKFNEYYVQKF